jgi:hypothetical protein
MLEHEPNLLPHIFAMFMKGVTVQPDIPLGGPIEPSQKQEQGCLPRAGRAAHTNHLTRLYGQRNAIEDSSPADTE